ncbi:MAG: multidrug efflux RND transporter permease subunit [Burkholderiales bacterium]|nr:multidrug efflux RND transporter permease subunit [Burkholderiales bacterium]
MLSVAGANPSALFIQRPVATTLLALAIALAGWLGFKLLPVSALPQVDFPTISVSASLPGASPETMAATVATPLERTLGRIAGVTEMTSSSSQGSTRITLQFDLSRDIDGAARDVQAAINAARSLLPSGMPGNPTYRKVNPADSPVMILALTSATLDRGRMYDAASTLLAQRIAQVEGVGQVDVGGASLPAVRVELDPNALNRMGLSTAEVRQALADATSNRPLGAVEQGTRRWQIETGAAGTAEVMRADDFAPLVIAWRSGAAVRLQDVAEVRDGVQDIRNAGLSNGKPAVTVLIRRQPGANVIETVDRVRALMPELRAMVPGAVQLDIVSDSTKTIRASLREVETALAIAVGLVIVVVYAFLRNVRAAAIPAVAVPVSLMGAFAVMYLCGYSLNNLSLMALTVATGFVVDDAVVVLENIARHIEAGMRPFEAALQGAREVGFTVVSMTISLIAVFIPIFFMGGIVGRLFQEFAVTLSVAIVVSLLVSLTVTPMMAARLLKPQAEVRHGRISLAVGRLLDGMTRGYARSLGWVLRHPVLTLAVLGATIAVNVWLYVIVPKGFLPQQDSGRLVGGIQADQSISFQAMQAKLLAFQRIVMQDPAVENVVGFTGGGQRNSAFMFVNLKPREQRGGTADDVIHRIRNATAGVPGARLFFQSAQDIRVGGRAGNAQYQYTLQADELSALREWEPRIRQALSELPELADVSTDQQDKGLQTTLAIDRDAAARLGLDVRSIGSTLNDLFGQRQVATLYDRLNQYKVVMEAAPRFWQGPQGLEQVHVMTADGRAVPLSAFASWGPGNTALSVSHQGSFVASTVSFNLAPGVSLSAAQQAIRDAMARIGVPTGVQGSFQGTAKAFQEASNNQPLLILAALVAVYLVLGILYESLVHPVTILSTLPSAGVGALLALLATKTEFSLIALIGVILLIGIVKKNAIMMVDFALQAQREGSDAREAIHQAAVLRLRPIMMTTAAALLGALPLALGRGDGAELRTPLGISIVGGLLLSQVLTLYTTPVVFLALERARQRLLRAGARLRGMRPPPHPLPATPPSA